MLTVAEYAEREGISTQAVYGRIKRGTLATSMQGGVQYVVENGATDLQRRLEAVEQERDALRAEVLKLQRELIDSKDDAIRVLSAYITETKQLQRPDNAPIDTEIEPKKGKGKGKKKHKKGKK
jgi:predicted DNA-binding protein YlxM (UPF0122 family)